MKAAAKQLATVCGYDVRRISGGIGRDPFRDMRTLTTAPIAPVIFDVGANEGQSIAHFRRSFDRPVIHAFEPGDLAFHELVKRTNGMPNLHLIQAALGSRSEVKTLIQNSHSDLSSFLEPGADWWGSIDQRRQVEVWTLDEYAERNGISHIDILKTDTQGFDLEVIRGGRTLIEQQGIHLIYIEITFSDMYKGAPRLDEVYRHLAESGFSLVSFYAFHYQNDRAAWTDALFIHSNYQHGERNAI